jgi:hypothetical protein
MNHYRTPRGSPQKQLDAIAALNGRLEVAFVFLGLGSSRANPRLPAVLSGGADSCKKQPAGCKI